MTFKTSYNAALGMPSVDLRSVDTVARVAIGTILKGFDDLLGEGEFMYLPGVAGTLAGDHVLFDLAPGAATTTRSTTGNANTGQPSAVAVAAVGAGQYGWYQVSGVAIVNVIGGTVAGRPFLSATAGSLSSTAAAGAHLIGARLSTAAGVPAASQAYLTLTRPAVQGQIT